MTNSDDLRLMANIHVVTKGIKALADRKEKAYYEWLRADHRVLSRKAEDRHLAQYLVDQAAEKRAMYDELAALYNERVESGLTWITTELEKRAK